MENRDKDKLSQGISQDKSKSDMNEPISKQSGSVGSGGMKSGSKVGGSSDLDKSSDLGSSSNKDKGSLGSE